MLDRKYLLPLPPIRFLVAGCLVSVFVLAFLFVRTLDSYDTITGRIFRAPKPVVPLSYPSLYPGVGGDWEFVAERDANDHGLSEEQCRRAFPKLFVEVDKSALLRADNHITYKELDSRSVEDGMGRAMVYRGQVCWLPSFIPLSIPVPLCLTLY